MVVCVLLLGGCLGRDFVRLPAASFVPGHTTEPEIRERLGAPYRETTATEDDVTIRTLSYLYASAAAALAGGLTPSRGQIFHFWQDVLVGHEFTSSFPEDSTHFDAAGAEEIDQGRTTEAEVVARLGPPHGAYVYPLVAGRDDRGLVYFYVEARGTPFDLRIYQQQLVVTLGADGLVKDVQLTVSGER